MDGRPRENRADEYVEWLEQRFARYGSGNQQSRDSFSLPGSTTRFCKIEGSGTKDRKLSLMTKNYGVDQEALVQRLAARGIRARMRPRYVVLDVDSIRQVGLALEVFGQMTDVNGR
jgi:hypothetical protein